MRHPLTFRSVGIVGLFIAVVTLAGTVRASDTRLVGDASVSRAYPSTNFGSLSNLYVGPSDSNGHPINITLLQFDLSNVPSAPVAHAELRFYVNRAQLFGHVDVALVISAWNESAVTYSTLPRWDRCSRRSR